MTTETTFDVRSSIVVLVSKACSSAPGPDSLRFAHLQSLFVTILGASKCSGMIILDTCC